MGKAFTDFLLGTASGAIGTGMGLLTANWNDKRQLRQQEKLNKLQILGTKELTDYQNQKQMEIWEKTNYAAQIAQMKKANLNPALIYGSAGAGGTLGGAAAAMTGAAAPAGGGELMGGMGMALQMEMMRAQIDNIKADTANKGEQKGDIIAGKELKVLEQVITKYAGLEAKDVYERIKSPNRGIEAKTYQDELEARQGIAGTIYELWLEGNLKEKSLNEIAEIALKNAKTTEEIENIKKQRELLKEQISGQKLENAITELEKKLQETTGIDKNAPTWLKILGRLFTTWFTK